MEDLAAQTRSDRSTMQVDVELLTIAPGTDPTNTTDSLAFNETSTTEETTSTEVSVISSSTGRTETTSEVQSSWSAPDSTKTVTNKDQPTVGTPGATDTQLTTSVNKLDLTTKGKKPVNRITKPPLHPPPIQLSSVGSTGFVSSTTSGMVTSLPSLQQETASGSTVSQTAPEQTVFTGTETTEITTTKLNSQSSTTKLPRTLVGFEKSTGTSSDTQTQGTLSSTKATQHHVTGSSEETDSTEVDSSASVTLPNPGGISSSPRSIGTVNVPPSASVTANPVTGTDSSTMDDLTHVNPSVGSQTVAVTQVTSTGNSSVSPSQQTGGSPAANTAGAVTQPTSDPSQQTMGAAVTQVTSGGNFSPQTVGPAATNNAGAVTQVTSAGNSSQQTMAAPVTLEGNSSQNVIDPAVTIPTSVANSSQPTLGPAVTLEGNSSQNVVDPAVTIPTSAGNSSQPTMGPAVTQAGNSVDDSSQPPMDTASVNQADSVVTLSGSEATVNLQYLSTVGVDQIGAVTQDSMGNNSSSGNVVSTANTANGSQIEAVTSPISGTGYTDTQLRNITGENDVEMVTGEASERNYTLAGETGNTAGYAEPNGTGAAAVTFNSTLEAVSVTGSIPGDGEMDPSNTTGSEPCEISSGTVPQGQMNTTDEAESTATGSDEGASKNFTKNTTKSTEEGTTPAGLVSGATGPSGEISHRNTTQNTLTTRNLSQGASSGDVSPQGNSTFVPKNYSFSMTNSTENPVHGSLLTGATDPVNTNTSPIHAVNETTPARATQAANATDGPSDLVVPTTTTPYSSENSKNGTQNSNGSGGSVILPPVEAPVYPNTTKTPEKVSTTTSMTVVGVTQIVNETSVKLDNGDIIITQLIRYPNGTLTYRNMTEAGKTPKPEINLPQHSTTSTVLTCPQITVDISNSVSPKQNSPELLGRQSVGTLVVHMCAVSYVFPSAQQPLKIYECMADGNWTRNANGEKCEYVSSRLKNSNDL